MTQFFSEKKEDSRGHVYMNGLFQEETLTNWRRRIFIIIYGDALIFLNLTQTNIWNSTQPNATIFLRENMLIQSYVLDTGSHIYLGHKSF